MKLELLTRLPEILFTIGKAIGSDESLSSTLATISELVTELTGAQACSIMLADSERKLLLGKAAYGLARDDVSEISFCFGEGVAGWVAQHSQSTLIHEADDDPRFVSNKKSKTDIRSLACVPLIYRDNVVGVLTVTSPEPNSVTNDSVDLLQLIANTIALDIENIRLQRLSVTDKLTGAYNREFLDSQLPMSLEESERRNEPFSVIMLDIDHFKNVNDTYGHGVGDDVLRILGQRFRESSRGRDKLVRYGGEEFLLLLPGANLAIASEIADRMRIQLQDNPIIIGQRSLSIRLSAGVAKYKLGETPANLYNRADTALYAAKNLGRNRVEVAE